MSAATSFDFLTLSASTHDAAGLARQLTEHSAEGWDVVSIVNTSSQLTAFLKRPAGAADTDAGTESAAVESAAVESVVAPEPVATPDESASTSTFAAAESTDGWAASTSTPSYDPSPAPSPEPVVTQAVPVQATPPVQSTPAVPAGWYSDPSGRYELRYWDGTAWTEHVARNGQQFTDQPVA